MKLPIATQFGAGLALAIAVLSAIYFTAASSITLYRESAALSRANRDYQQGLLALLQSTVDAETAQRGFIITGKEAYLAPMRQAAPAIDAQMAAARDLAEQIGPGVGQRLAELDRDIVRKLAELQQVIDLGRTDRAAAIDLIESDTGRRLMDHIRAEIAQLAGDADTRLQDSRAGTDTAFRRLSALTSIGIGITIVLLVVIGFLGVFSVKRRIDAVIEASKRLGAGELDHRVAVRGRDEISVLATAFNHMAAQLKDSNESLDSFAYTVSHDLRAPLRAMEGFAQSLLEDYGDKLDDTGKDYANRIVNAGRRMGELIQDLLAYSRLSRSDFRLSPESLGDIVREAKAAVTAEFAAAAAVIVTEGEFPRVIGHRPTLRQMVINLLSNALKFVAPGATPAIRLYGERLESRYRLWVEDNGIGIAPEHRDRIFKIFERLHGLESYPGTGIGLAIVSKGAERMGGSAGVDANPAGGSRFWIELAMENAA